MQGMPQSQGSTTEGTEVHGGFLMIPCAPCRYDSCLYLGAAILSAFGCLAMIISLILS